MFLYITGLILLVLIFALEIFIFEKFLHGEKHTLSAYVFSFIIIFIEFQLAYIVIFMRYFL